MDRFQQFLNDCFVRDFAELRRAVDIGRARGWLWQGSPAEPPMQPHHRAKKKPATKRGGRKGGR